MSRISIYYGDCFDYDVDYFRNPRSDSYPVLGFRSQESAGFFRNPRSDSYPVMVFRGRNPEKRDFREIRDPEFFLSLTTSWRQVQVV